MMPWSDVAVFLAVMREGSAAAAARVLRTNQTTVSRRIDRLQDQLNLKLFEVGPRGANPTSAAHRLLPDAEAMEAAAQGFTRHAEDLSRRVTGTIRLTSNPTAIQYAAGVIRRFEEEFPGTHVEIDTDTRTLSLEKGEADVALRVGQTLTGDTLIARKLFEHPWGVYADETYLQRFGAPRGFDDLAGHQMVHLVGDQAAAEPLLTGQSRLLVDGVREIRTEAFYSLIGLVRAGEGLGLLPRAEGDPVPNLRYLFSEPDLKQGLWLITTAVGHGDPLIRSFFRFVGQALPNILRGLPPEWRA